MPEIHAGGHSRTHTKSPIACRPAIHPGQRLHHHHGVPEPPSRLRLSCQCRPCHAAPRIDGSGRPDCITCLDHHAGSPSLAGSTSWSIAGLLRAAFQGTQQLSNKPTAREPGGQSGRRVITIMRSAVTRRCTGTLATFWQIPFKPVLPRRSVTIRMDGAAGR